ncbi:DnaB-like helicase C-terminal domain-containing protein [Enterococcus sp. AZ163]|uniref:DnaB-like helicase C-terminal domain-containing protein n=1 Tax=Enterococcus sp. AZ163 TaxID=2774638 RepID=UPI003D26E0E0
MNNNEMTIVSCLLSNPHLINDFEIDDEWFENAGFAAIIKAINQLKGQEYRTVDVHRRLKANAPLYTGKQEELDILADMKIDEGILETAIHFIRVDYVEQRLREISKNYSKHQKDEYAKQLKDLLEERESLKRQKQSGKIGEIRPIIEDQLFAAKDNLIQTFSNLDRVLGGGLSAGQLVVIGARPQTGKTAMGLNMMLKALTRNEGVRADFFSFEMDKVQLFNRLVSKLASIDSNLLRKMHQLSPDNKKKVLATLDHLEKYNAEFYGYDYQYLNDIKRQIKKRAIPNKYIAFIDYAGLIKSNDPRKNERQAMNEVTRELKILTNELQIPIILFAQIGRAVEHRDNKRPTLADLKESGSLEQDANVVILLSLLEPDRKDLILADIAKNREGINAELQFKFIGKFMDFDTDYLNKP